MAGSLRQYFPMIKSREEILEEITNKTHLKKMFSKWTETQQGEFLDFCTGVRGVKLLYDSFFKEIMNPENVPERLNEFLSLLLGQKVRIESVLPNDSSRIADESSLLIMDILVRLEDGSLCNVEVQKIGYRFPGERSACYSADLLLRQYKRIRGNDTHKNAYKDMKNVYTIILFERSPSEFKQFPEAYVHQFSQKSDTGLEINLLQKYIFIPLDIFLRNIHNKGIRNKLDGWLAFFCDDSPERIIELLEKYPEFKPLYEHVYEMCRNVEKVMEMYSKELLEMDRNTVQYMIDEMQEEINQKEEELSQKNVQLKQKKEELNQKNVQLNQKEEELSQKNVQLNQKKEELSQKDAQLKQINAQLEQERREHQEAMERMQRQIQELQKK